MISKIQLVALCAFVIVVSGLSIALSAVTHERDILKLEIERMNAELALSSQSLMQSNEAIARQNEAVRVAKAELDNKTAALTNDYERLNKKYQLLANKSAEKLGAAPDCSAQLSSIYEAQEAFCYER